MRIACELRRGTWVDEIESFSPCHEIGLFSTYKSADLCTPIARVQLRSSLLSPTVLTITVARAGAAGAARRAGHVGYLTMLPRGAGAGQPGTRVAPLGT